jgi:hypothetical protein
MLWDMSYDMIWDMRCEIGYVIYIYVRYEIWFIANNLFKLPPVKIWLRERDWWGRSMRLRSSPAGLHVRYMQ